MSCSDSPWKPCGWNGRLVCSGDMANVMNYIGEIHIASMSTADGVPAILLTL